MILKGAAMKILITGGTTFVSKYTAEYFIAKGNDVTAINRGVGHRLTVLRISTVTEQL